MCPTCLELPLCCRGVGVGACRRPHLKRSGRPLRFVTPAARRRRRSKNRCSAFVHSCAYRRTWVCKARSMLGEGGWRLGGAPGTVQGRWGRERLIGADWVSTYIPWSMGMRLGPSCFKMCLHTGKHTLGKSLVMEVWAAFPSTHVRGYWCRNTIKIGGLLISS